MAINSLEDLDMPADLIADIRRVDRLDREGKRNEALKLSSTLLPRLKAYHAAKSAQSAENGI